MDFLKYSFLLTGHSEDCICKDLPLVPYQCAFHPMTVRFLTKFMGNEYYIYVQHNQINFI